MHSIPHKQSHGRSRSIQWIGEVTLHHYQLISRPNLHAWKHCLTAELSVHIRKEFSWSCFQIPLHIITTWKKLFYVSIRETYAHKELSKLEYIFPCIAFTQATIICHVTFQRKKYIQLTIFSFLTTTMEVYLIIWSALEISAWLGTFLRVFQLQHVCLCPSFKFLRAAAVLRHWSAWSTAFCCLSKLNWCQDSRLWMLILQ